MKVSIVRCIRMDFETEVAAIVKALETELGINPDVIPGKGGQFDVFASDKLVIGKTGRLFGRVPTPEEVLKALSEVDRS